MSSRGRLTRLLVSLLAYVPGRSAVPLVNRETRPGASVLKQITRSFLDKKT